MDSLVYANFHHLSFPSINLMSLTRYDMTSKRHRPQPKLTFAILGKQLMYFKGMQYHPQMTHVITLIFRIYQDVVNEDNDQWIQVTSKHFIHKIHERRRGICETKEHY